jgi:uncharacterized membrane protein (DUF2068 family)
VSVTAPGPDFAPREVPAVPGDSPRPGASEHSGLRAVALFEFGKGVLALLAAGGLELIGPMVLRGWLHAGGAAMGLDARHDAIVALSRALNPDSIHVAAGIAAVYAAMRLAEAWGLWRARAWASWLGCIGAAVYLPLDLYALATHPGWVALGVLAVNLWVVRVLARDLAARRGTVSSPGVFKDGAAQHA